MEDQNFIDQNVTEFEKLVYSKAIKDSTSLAFMFDKDSSSSEEHEYGEEILQKLDIEDQEILDKYRTRSKNTFKVMQNGG